jgi:hypothetical protein
MTYEEAVDPGILLRALSYAGRVDRTTLEDFENWDKLSTAENLKPYEEEMFANKLAKGQPVRGERERIALWQKLLNRNWRAIDMTGNDIRYRTLGGGYYHDVAAVLQSDLRQKLEIDGRQVEIYIAGLGIDYAGALVERHITSHKLERKEQYDLLSKLPMNLKNYVAGRFNCPVWVLHQLSGVANSRSSGHVMHHTDAAGSKSFAENLDFCFTIGTPTKDNLCVFAKTKSRRAQRQGEVVVRVRGEISRVDPTFGRYTNDRGRIVSSSDYNRVADPGSAPGMMHDAMRDVMKMVTG